jgi:excinuclease UvrABC ATPase subunit
VIKQADWIVDLGPEGGEAGGEIVAVGAPEEVALVPGSFTGQYLRGVLPAQVVSPTKQIGSRRRAVDKAA